ncbi:MAG: hypothetical protein WD533_01635 [Dehalococcoidia bacterium]
MNDLLVQEVVGELVGTVTSYEPSRQSAKVMLRGPLRTGMRVRFASDGTEWEEPLRFSRGVLAGRKYAPQGEEVVIRVHRPVKPGADVYRLW